MGEAVTMFRKTGRSPDEDSARRLRRAMAQSGSVTAPAFHYASCGLRSFAAAFLLFTPLAASAQSPFSPSPFRFTHQDGETLYRAVCAGCHMGDGRGAVGAGAYPSLARNAKLAAGGYPVTLVVNGQKAMPPFGRVLDDNQVAAVVNYIRGNFGNAYPDRVTPDDAKAARQ
jgi:mono/diheme cytochrome c family protein